MGRFPPRYPPSGVYLDPPGPGRGCLGMKDENNAISQTVRRQAGNRDVARLPLVQVVGGGESIESLQNPRFVTFGEILEIGRRPGSAEGRTSLVLADRTVSSLHARITRMPESPDGFVIQDLGSTNGTFADGRRIEGTTGLPSGTL